jgi:aminopeptidase
MRDPRLEKLADVLVNYSVGVKKGQSVRITGSPVSQPLIIELYRKALAAGGHPLVRVTPDELSEIFYKNASEAQLAYFSPVAMYEIEQVDCSIGIWANENTKALTGCDSKKIGVA